MSSIYTESTKKDLYKIHYNIQQECEKMLTHLKKIKRKSDNTISFLMNLNHFDMLRSYPSTYDYLNKLYIKLLEQNCVFELFFLECEEEQYSVTPDYTITNKESKKNISPDNSCASAPSNYMSADSNTTDELFMGWNELVANNTSTATLKNIESNEIFSKTLSTKYKTSSSKFDESTSTKESSLCEKDIDTQCALTTITEHYNKINIHKTKSSSINML